MAFSIRDYTDLKEAGRGGMGRVFVAVQKSLHRRVILKALSPRLVGSPEQVRRFENEARAAASLSHDNVIRVFDFGPDSGAFFICMEYVDGITLRDLVKGGLPHEIGLMVALKAIRGLRHAHRNSVAHRDVKPANILVSHEGAVKVVDFGLAGAIDRIPGDTTTDLIMGTPLFMSPEHAEGINRATYRSDMFSVGILLYWILSGEYPFPGKRTIEILRKIHDEDPPPLHSVAPTTPPAMADLVHQYLRKKPEERPDTFDPIIDCLQKMFLDMRIPDTTMAVAAYARGDSEAVNRIQELLGRYYIRCAEDALSLSDRESARFLISRGKEFVGEIPEIEKVCQAIAKPTSRVPSPTENSETEISTKSRIKSAENPILVHVLSVVVALLVVALGAGVYYWRTTMIARELAVAPRTPIDSVSQRDTFSNTSRKRSPRGQSNARSATSRNESTRKPSRPEKVPTMVRMEIFPSGATVTIDGKEYSNRALSRGVELAPGDHVVRAGAPGYQGDTLDLYMIYGTTQLLTVALDRLGYLSVHATPAADIFLNGDKVGNTSSTAPLSLKPGGYSLLLMRSEYLPYSDQIRVTAGDTVRIDVTLDPSKSRSSTAIPDYDVGDSHAFNP